MVIRSSGDLDIYCMGQTILDAYHYSTYNNSSDVLTGFDIGKYKFDEHVEVMMTTYAGLLFSLIPKRDENELLKLDPKNIKVLICLINFRKI